MNGYDESQAADEAACVAQFLAAVIATRVYDQVGQNPDVTWATYTAARDVLRVILHSDNPIAALDEVADLEAML